MKIAVIPVGYGDGYNRKLSNCFYVLIGGKKAPILGRICMDVFIVDVTHIDNAEIGSTVTLIGTDENEIITADMLAEQIGTISYEVFTSINTRTKNIIYSH